MTDLRTAAQQALQALENAEDQLAKPYSTDASKAITALRAALVQQAEPQPAPMVEDIQRLRAERDALAERLAQARAQLTDTTEAALNAWAEQKLARYGIPMPDEP